MATMTLTLPDPVAARVIDALCRHGDRPVSPANAKAVVIELIKQTVVAVETADAIAALPLIAPDVDGIVT